MSKINLSLDFFPQFFLFFSQENGMVDSPSKYQHVDIVLERVCMHTSPFF